MRSIAALYDIHGNLPALEAVLDDVRSAGVDEVVVGGDVFPGPMAGRSLARLLDFDRPVRFLRGNGDREVLALAEGGDAGGLPEAYRDVVVWSAERLRKEHRTRVASWPSTIRIEVRGLGRVLFCHATPDSDTEIFTRETSAERLRSIVRGVDEDVLVCGHTHMQFDLRIGSLRAVNAGSVGMPFGRPGAYWLLLGPNVQLRRTDYDRVRAAERVRRTDYPQAAAFVERNVLSAPTEREMLDVFAGAGG